MKIASLSIADYAEATEGMPHDVERLYFRMLLKMYSREGGIPDDDADCARIFGYRDVRTYKALKARLLAWPDAIQIIDGVIVNTRAMKDLEDYRAHKDRARENGKLGGRPKKTESQSQTEFGQAETEFGLISTRSQVDLDPISSRSRSDLGPISDRSQADLESISHATHIKNNDLENHLLSPTPLIVKEPPTPLQGDGGSIQILDAFETYNATALRCGLPQASKLTPDRKRKISARLKEFGPDGWRQALANIERSSFLCGLTDHGFRADLDFLVQAKSFSKVHDGGFGNGRHAKIQTVTVKQAPDPYAGMTFDERLRFDPKLQAEMLELAGE